MGILDSIAGIFNGAGRLWGSIFGSKETTEKNISREKTTAQEALVEEARSTMRRTDFFTVFVEGVNRLVRPTFSYGTVAFFVWAVYDPINFTISMQALALVPDFMYGIFLTIVGFWFGGRIVEKYADAKLRGPSAEQLQEVLENQRRIMNGNYSISTTVSPQRQQKTVVIKQTEPTIRNPEPAVVESKVEIVNEPAPPKPKPSLRNPNA
jgi:hypothetical protein